MVTATSSPDKWPRPLRALLVCGDKPYGNVKRLPIRLRDEYGIDCDPREIPHLVIGLCDITGHGALRKAKEFADSLDAAFLSVPSCWSKIVAALTLIGIRPLPTERILLNGPNGRDYHRVSDIIDMMPEVAMEALTEEEKEEILMQNKNVQKPSAATAVAKNGANAPAPVREDVPDLLGNELRTHLKAVLGVMKRMRLASVCLTASGEVDLERIASESFQL